MVFQDPILAGATLVRDGIQSENYVSGQAGWRIGRDGFAEFLNGLYRGSLDLGSGGQYDPKIHLGSDIPTELVSFYANSNPVRACILFYSGQGSTPANLQYVYIALTTGPGVANLAIGYWDTTAIREHLVVDGGIGSLRLGSAAAAAVVQTRKPITLVGEDWQNMVIAAPYAARGGAYAPPRFRKVACPPNAVQLDGQITLNGAASGAILATLPAGYRPTTYTASAPLMANPGASGVDVEVDKAGNVRLWGHSGTGPAALFGYFCCD